MNKSPLITVYITNYNYGNYLEQAIESVLAQTFEDFELIIIDDGSTDDSRQKIENYASYRKVTIIYQINRGLVYSNNIAVRLAKGKYLMRLDADDYLDPQALSVMAAMMEHDNELGLVFPDYYYIDSDGAIIGEQKRHNFLSDVTLFDQPAHGACTLIRHTFLTDLGGYNELFSCQDGYDIWLKFINNHKVANINIPLFYYRIHNTNLTRNEDKILSTRKKINEQYIEKNTLKTPLTVVLIPVRNTFFGTHSWPMYACKNNKTILENTIEVTASSEKISLVVVSSDDESLINSVKHSFHSNKKIIAFKRPYEYARFNEPLNKTIDFIIPKIVKRLGVEPEAIMVISLEFPFITKENIEDALHCMTIFETDSLLSIRPDNRTYYQHDGHGMKPILDQDKFTKLEREALYAASGGIILFRYSHYCKTKKIISGKIGHIIVDEKSGFCVHSDFTFQIFQRFFASFTLL